MAAPKIIEELIDKFDSDPAFYRSIHFNETEVRTQFINPFFEALGWDVYHKCRPDNRDVKEEDAVKVEGKTKNPDYSFRLFEKRKFFVEVKKPSINIESGIYPAYQIRSYAWSADLPISILTDFEEFSVYYCHTRPFRDDKPTKSRLLYLRYDQYAEKWPEIAALFSREAVLNGSLDKYVRSLPQKRGDKRVDAALLEDISEWREMLAKNIALHNPELDTMSLNYSVQAIIDRIMFLRICEDRGIEQYMRLKDLLNGERVYPRLCELFRRADERYNSGIFHFKKEPGRDNPDTITLNLNIDDVTLKEIIKHLYFPESPYAFSVLPAEILGQIYEQFLGKVIRLDESHIAWVEDKPEVKKAGGVKYTPVYIVEAIVKKTLGPTLEGKTPLAVVLISVLDPACGSGSFLIVAYQYLLDWHRDWYVQNLVPLLQSGLKPSSPEIRRLLPGVETGKKGRKKEPELPVYQGRDGEWRLTTAERKRILLNNIYGVDIDRQAVEVTKLSLLLKVLEGENDETISKQLTLFQERALPDLSNNIKCGNSLIGWDILKDNPGMGQDEIDRINPFDWEKEFPEIFLRGGFSVVIGNPPYIRIQMMKEWAPLEVEYYKQKYASASKGNYDIYVVFVERGLSLLNDGGRLGFILPNKFFNSQYGQPIRQLIAEGKHLSEIVHFGSQQVFQGATTYTCLLFLNRSESEIFSFMKVNDLIEWQNGGETDRASITSESITDKEWNFAVGESAKLFAKLNNMVVKLGDFAEIFVGLQTSADDVFIMDLIEELPQSLRLKSKSLGSEFMLEKGLLFPLISGTDVNRYASLPYRQYILFPYNVDKSVELIDFNELLFKYPSIANYLNKNKERLEERENGRMRGDKWYGYIYLKNMKKQSVKKLCIPRLVNYLYATYDRDGNHFLDNVDVGGVTLKPEYQEHGILYLLGILNSRLIRWYFPFVSAPFRGGWMSANRQFLSQVPIKPTDFSDPSAKTRYDCMVSLVDQMLSLHKQLPEARTPHEQTSLQRQIEATDGQIDALVYELYGLTEEEIRIVEGKCI